MQILVSLPAERIVAMFFMKKIGCRIFQMSFRLALPFLPYREPEIVSSCADLGSIFQREAMLSVLIVTDGGIVKNGLTHSLEAVIKSAGVSYVIFDKTQPNPTVNNVEEALTLYKKYHCDSLIAIGGGSAMDCAKAVGARVAYPKKALQKLGGVLKIRRSIPTLIAIPTTAGTGSETTLAAVITDSENCHKYALMSFPLIPRYAVLDPSLTYSLPPHLTATTGMDALTHAIEAYLGRSTTKETRTLALDATKLVFENLIQAYQNGADRNAREGMLLAAYKAGIAFSKSYVGYVHGVAHSLGGRYGTPHGLANAVILPHVLELYGGCVIKKLHRLGVAAGVCGDEDCAEVGAKKFIEAIRFLQSSLNIPSRIEEIEPQDIPMLAKYAERESNPLYPVPKLMTSVELEEIYRRIL